MSEEKLVKRKRGRPRSTPEDEEIEIFLVPLVEDDGVFKKRESEVQEILKRIILLGMKDGHEGPEDKI